MKRTPLKKIFAKKGEQQKGKKSPRTPSSEDVWGELCISFSPKIKTPPLTPNHSNRIGTSGVSNCDRSAGGSDVSSNDGYSLSSLSNTAIPISQRNTIKRKNDRPNISIERLSSLCFTPRSPALRNISSKASSPSNIDSLSSRQSQPQLQQQQKKSPSNKYSSVSAVDLDAPIEHYEGPIDLDESIHTSSSAASKDSFEENDENEYINDRSAVDASTTGESSPDTIPVMYEDGYENEAEPWSVENNNATDLTTTAIATNTNGRHGGPAISINNAILYAAPVDDYPFGKKITNDEAIDIVDDSSVETEFSLEKMAKGEEEDTQSILAMSTVDEADEVSDYSININARNSLISGSFVGNRPRHETDDSALDDEDYYKQDYFSMMTQSKRTEYEKIGQRNEYESRLSLSERVLLTGEVPEGYYDKIVKRFSLEELMGLTEPEVPEEIESNAKQAEEAEEGGDYGDFYTDVSFPVINNKNDKGCDDDDALDNGNHSFAGSPESSTRHFSINHDSNPINHIRLKSISHPQDRIEQHTLPTSDNMYHGNDNELFNNANDEDCDVFHSGKKLFQAEIPVFNNAIHNGVTGSEVIGIKFQEQDVIETEASNHKEDSMTKKVELDRANVNSMDSFKDVAELGNFNITVISNIRKDEGGSKLCNEILLGDIDATSTNPDATYGAYASEEKSDRNVAPPMLRSNSFNDILSKKTALENASHLRHSIGSIFTEDKYPEESKDKGQCIFNTDATYILMGGDVLVETCKKSPPSFRTCVPAENLNHLFFEQKALNETVPLAQKTMSSKNFSDLDCNSSLKALSSTPLANEVSSSNESLLAEICNPHTLDTIISIDNQSVLKKEQGGESNGVDLTLSSQVKTEKQIGVVYSMKDDGYRLQPTVPHQNRSRSLSPVLLHLNSTNHMEKNLPITRSMSFATGSTNEHCPSPVSTPHFSFMPFVMANHQYNTGAISCLNSKTEYKKRETWSELEIQKYEDENSSTSELIPADYPESKNTQAELSIPDSPLSLTISKVENSDLKLPENSNVDISKIINENRRLRIKRQQLCESLGSMAQQFVVQETATAEKVFYLEQKIHALIAEREQMTEQSAFIKESGLKYDAETVYRLSSGVLKQDKLLESKDKQISQLKLRCDVLTRTLQDKKDRYHREQKLREEEQEKWTEQCQSNVSTHKRQNQSILRQELLASKTEVAVLKDKLDKALSDIAALTVALESNNETLDNSVCKLRHLQKLQSENHVEHNAYTEKDNLLEKISYDSPRKPSSSHQLDLGELSLSTPLLKDTNINGKISYEDRVSQLTLELNEKNFNIAQLQTDLDGCRKELKKVREMMVFASQNDNNEVNLLKKESQACNLEVQLFEHHCENLSLHNESSDDVQEILIEKPGKNGNLENGRDSEIIAREKSFNLEPQEKDENKDFPLISQLQDKILSLEKKLIEYECNASGNNNSTCFPPSENDSCVEESSYNNNSQSLLPTFASNETKGAQITGMLPSPTEKELKNNQSPLNARRLFQIGRSWTSAVQVNRSPITNPFESHDLVQEREMQITHLQATIKTNTDTISKLKEDILKMQQEKDQTEIDFVHKIQKMQEENAAYSSQVAVLEKAFMALNDQRSLQAGHHDGPGDIVMEDHPTKKESHSTLSINNVRGSTEFSSKNNLLQVCSMDNNKLQDFSQLEEVSNLEKLQEQVTTLIAQKMQLENQLIEMKKSTSILCPPTAEETNTNGERKNGKLSPGIEDFVYCEQNRVSSDDPSLIVQVVMLENANKVLESSILSLQSEMELKFSPLYERIALLEEEKLIIEDEMNAKLECREMTISNLESALQQLTSSGPVS